MIVKPHDFISKGRGYADPAVICCGPEYLRILYGPEYLLTKNLELLRSRDLGANRSFVSREFALGIESLEVFVLKEPLRRTHECAFSVLALESEFVDPRLRGRNPSEKRRQKRRPAIIHSQRDGSHERFLPEHRRVYRYAGRGI